LKGCVAYLFNPTLTNSAAQMHEFTTIETP
jgi:hypothetical protein